ncbi:MAG: RNA polymerase sigma factor [Gammaproteobacteria bacterium]|nr:RNA polymerase sigma factor [Gammaproteobacteria bacterium]
MQVVSLNDSEAFAVLVRRYQAKILLLHRRLARDSGIAEDLCQETFFRAWDKMATYRGNGRFAAWLSKLAYNVFLQHYRKSSRAIEASLHSEELPERTSELADELPDLERLLDVLNAEEQLLLVLNYAYGLTNDEIGRVLDQPAGTVKSHIFRAKAKIRQRYRIET